MSRPFTNDPIDDAMRDVEAAPCDWWRENAVTAAQLQRMTFPPLNFVLPDLLPEGLALLAGKPKAGKSWLALDVAIAVTADRYTLGDLKPEQGDALYLALEDSQRRIQRRLTKLLPTFGDSWPERLTIRTEWRRVDDGGLDGIRAWCTAVERPRLVITDTLEKIRPRPTNSGKTPAYSLDYQALEGLQSLASELGIAIVVVTHVRKAEADEVFDTISGTLGLTAAADTIMVLAQRHGAPALCIRGRDVEETEKALSFNKETCRWIILGSAAEVARSDTRGRILATLEEATEPLSPSEIASVAALDANTVNQQLFKMAPKGEVQKTKRGKYIHPDRAELLTVLDPSTPHNNSKNVRN